MNIKSLKLNKEQKDFLKKHGISIDEVFDGKNYSTAGYKELLKNTSYKVVVGVTPCQKKAHVMRTKSGHCVMCKPETLSHQARHSATSEIYVMLSSSTGLIKVGVADNAVNRQNSLNGQAYGGIKDWKIKYSSRITNSGFAEKLVHKKLKIFHNPIEHDVGNSDAANEIFNCTLRTALNAVKSIIN